MSEFMTRMKAMILSNELLKYGNAGTSSSNPDK